MSINYEEELINLLENNDIKTFPSQELIDSNIRVVKAIWRNFVTDIDEDEGFVFDEWYNAGDWGNKLKKYAEDFKLWEELLASKCYKSYLGSNNSSYDFILTEKFQKDFPKIADYFLNNDEKLILLFNKTHNKEFYDRLKLDKTKKEDIYKMFLIDSATYIDNESIVQFENDEEFVQKLLMKSPSYFQKLNLSNRNKIENIKIALRTMDNFFYLSDEMREKFFKPWANAYMNQIRFKQLEQMTEEQTVYIFTHRKELLSNAINSGKYEIIATNILTQDLDSNLSYFSEEAIKKFSKNKSNMKKIYGQLEKFVEEYADSGFSKKDKKMLILVREIPELKDKLQDNIFYRLNKLKEGGEKMNSEWFESITREAINLYENGKVNREKVEAFVFIAKGCLEISSLKELRLPKNNTFDYLKSIFLNKDLQSNLSDNSDKINKPKFKI